MTFRVMDQKAGSAHNRQRGGRRGAIQPKRLMKLAAVACKPLGVTTQVDVVTNAAGWALSGAVTDWGDIFCYGTLRAGRLPHCHARDLPEMCQRCARDVTETCPVQYF
jgi:hypothetical protein